MWYAAYWEIHSPKPDQSSQSGGQNLYHSATRIQERWSHGTLNVALEGEGAARFRKAS